MNASSLCGLAAGVAAEEVAEAPCTEAAAPVVGTVVAGEPGTVVVDEPGTVVVETSAVGAVAASSTGTSVVVGVSLTPVTLNLQVSSSWSSVASMSTSTVIVFSPDCIGDRLALIDPPSPSASTPSAPEAVPTAP